MDRGCQPAEEEGVDDSAMDTINNQATADNSSLEICRRAESFDIELKFEFQDIADYDPDLLEGGSPSRRHSKYLLNEICSENAAGRAELTDFSEEFPNGYDTSMQQSDLLTTALRSRSLLNVGSDEMADTAENFDEHVAEEEKNHGNESIMVFDRSNSLNSDTSHSPRKSTMKGGNLFVGHNILRNRKKKAKNSPEGKGKKQKKKTDLNEESAVEGGDVPLVFCCPVCLDVYFNAHILRPCGHTFCEPCLRRLAKYSQDAQRTTTCPVCRDPIDVCLENRGLTEQVRFCFPADYRRRNNTEANNKYMRHPLPSGNPAPFSSKRLQLSHIVSRLDRNRYNRRRPTLGSTPMRINFSRFISFALAFIILKGMLLSAAMCLYFLIYETGFHIKLVEGAANGMSEFSKFIPISLAKVCGFIGALSSLIFLWFGVRHFRPKGKLLYQPLQNLSQVRRMEL